STVIRCAACAVEGSVLRSSTPGHPQGDPMTDTSTEDRPTGGVVERLARDDLERKKFLKMAGKRIGAGAAGTSLAAFIAACGSSSSSSSSAGTSSSAAAASGPGVASSS